MPFISEVESIYIQRFYTGWITLRNQLATPIRVMGRRVVELYDALIAGNDWEVTPYLSLKRRAGHTSFSLANSPALFFYSWKSNTQGTNPIVDTNTDIEYIASGAPVVIKTKAAGTGLNQQSSILGIGDYLYVGNPQINFKWDGPSGSQGVTNWGIASSSLNNITGPKLTGAGANSGSGTAWTNPNNVTNTGSSYATILVGALNNSQSLHATQFGFSLSASTIITGIAVTITFNQNTNKGTSVVLLKSGSGAGVPKAVLNTGTLTLGGPSDLWGTTWTANDINSTGFGCGMANVFSNLSYQGALNNVNITVYGIGGPSANPAGSGSFAAINGWSYVVAYGNSVSGEISNASAISANTGPFSSKLYVGVTVPPSSDTQVNQGRVYRTTDSGGGNQFFEIPNSPFPNIGYTLTAAANAVAGSTVYTGTPTPAGNFAAAVGQNFIVAGFSTGANNGTFACTASSASTITLSNAGGVAETHAATAYLLAEDTAGDTSLQVTSQAEINLGNTPPPVGLINLEWFSGRMWGSVNNLLYASTGPETISGTAPNSNWNPTFQWVIPGVIVRNVRWTNGLLVFTQDDCYIVRGTDITNYTVNEFVKNFGVRSYNAIDTDGTNLYVFTSDRQFILMSASGAQDIGLPIADQLLTVDPTQCYVTVNRYGLDSIVRILDTVNDLYYDYNLNQQCWNLPGVLQMPSTTAMGSIEVSPGVWRLMLCSTNVGVSTLAYRDITNFQDLGTPYLPNAVFGSIQLADPGTLAKFGGAGGLVLEWTSAGKLPVLSVLANDIGCTPSNALTAGGYGSGGFGTGGYGGGNSQITGFFSILPNPIDWPPTLGAQAKNYRSKGYYWMSNQTQLSAFVRHIQFQVNAFAENQPTELIGFGIFGDLKQESAQSGQLPQLQGK